MVRDITTYSFSNTVSRSRSLDCQSDVTVTIEVAQGGNNGMMLKNWLRLLIIPSTVAAILLISLVAPSTGDASTKKALASTITLAESPGGSPNFIFPFQNCQTYSVQNINTFQSLMFRPLYWFGLGTSSTVVSSLSLAKLPVMSRGNRTVTIDMKGWKFADGQAINAQSVMFFLNMYKADPTAYCGYDRGYGIPDQVTGVRGQRNTVTINFKRSVNRNWILYNYLSQIVPFPNSWDVTRAHRPSICATGAYGATRTNKACTAVERFLTAQSNTPSTYTGALWQSGDSGPWRLSKFDNLGGATFVPNTKYSGPQKAQVAFVKEVPFTTTSAEEHQLQAGAIDIGYVDPAVMSSNARSPTKPGANWSPIAKRYRIEVGSPWAVNFAALNFSPENPQAPLVSQLYIRQVLQQSVDQPSIINRVDRGYGYVQFNPLPPLTRQFLSGGASTVNPYPFNVTSAANLLKSHGWIKTNGVLECQNVGTGATNCGVGITKGESLELTLEYASGVASLSQTVNIEVAQWESLGIAITLTTSPVERAANDCLVNQSAWSICSWGTGWIYPPNYFPSGESLFGPRASFNIGSYNDPALTNLVGQSIFGKSTLATYANNVAHQLPILFQPTATNSFVGPGVAEVITTLKSKIGYAPNPLENFTPEYYHF